MQMAQALDVNLGTVRNVEAVLREASVPVSRYYILQRLKERGASTNHPRLELALAYLIEKQFVFEGSKGLQWVHSGSKSLARAALLGRRVA
ncbi:MAG: hypothetical protein AABY18_05540 [Candidatus Thermoplasmatota archaeon]